jgi:RNA polymerase sigma-70 factor (ECF subfamily)
LNPDDEIKSGLKSGDQDLFRNLFLTYYAQLLRYSSSITGDPEASRELVQDLFMGIWEKRRSIQISGSLKSYLYSSMYHKSLNWLRSQKIREKYRENPVEISQWLGTAPAPGPSDPFLLAEIDRQISLLPDQCREVFVKVAVLGTSIRETALTLGISEKTTENHLHKARKILRDRLKKFKRD